MKTKLFLILLIAITVIMIQPAYAAGYQFLFNPSAQFSKVDYALPGSLLFAVSDNSGNTGICDSSGKLVYPMSKIGITLNGNTIYSLRYL